MSTNWFDRRSTQEVARKVIAFATAADHEIAPAVAGKKVRLLAFSATCTGTAPAIRFESGAGGTALSGVMLPTAGTQIDWEYNPVGYLESAAGSSLSLEVGGTSPSIQGVAVYTYIDDDRREY